MGKELLTMRDLTKIPPTKDHPSIVWLTRMGDDGVDEVVGEIGVDLNWDIQLQFVFDRNNIFNNILNLVANQIATEMPFQIPLTGENDIMEVWGFE